MAKNIALIGSAPSSVKLAPFDSPDWEIWACSPGAWAVVPHADVWFELHRWEPGQPWMSPEYCNFIREFKGPVFLGGEVPEVKNGIQLPVKQLIQKYGPYFFTSTVAWMMALAIETVTEVQKHEGGEMGKIGLWGIDMAATEEYGYQRAGCQFFAQTAKVHGIEVGVPPESDLLRPSPLYGVCEWTHQWIKTLSRFRELSDRRNNIAREIKTKDQELHFVNGVLDDLQWAMNTFMGNVDSMDHVFLEPGGMQLQGGNHEQNQPEKKIAREAGSKKKAGRKSKKTGKKKTVNRLAPVGTGGNSASQHGEVPQSGEVGSALSGSGGHVSTPGTNVDK